MNLKYKQILLSFGVLCLVGGIIGVSFIYRMNFAEVSELEIGQNPQNSYIENDVMYIIDNDDEILIYNLSDPESPQQISRITGFNEIMSIEIDDSLLYLVDAKTGFHILNVSDPLSPETLGNYENTEDARDFTIQNSILYLISKTKGLEVLNISSLSNITQIAVINDLDYAFDIAVDRDYLYVADGETGLRIYNCSNPTQVFQLGVYNTQGSVQSLRLHSDLLYLANGDQGISILNISIPFYPIELSAYRIGTDVDKILLDGQNLYVVGGKKGVFVLNTEDPSHPIKEHRFDDGGTVIDVEVLEDYVYSISKEHTLEIIDTSITKEHTWNILAFSLIILLSLFIFVLIGLWIHSINSNLESFQNPQFISFWRSLQRIFKQNPLFVLTGHEFKLIAQARIQKIWFYLSIFYALLMIITSREIATMQSILSFFINFGTIFAFIPASSAISGEIGGIADTILSKSVKRWQYVFSKHLAYILIALSTYFLIIGSSIGILAALNAFDSSFKIGNLILIIGLNALILVMFTSLGVNLSSLFSKPIFPIMGSFVVWFILVFLFILVPTWNWNYSPVIINSHFVEIIMDTWNVAYWSLFTVFGSITLVNFGISIVAFYQLDF